MGLLKKIKQMVTASTGTKIATAVIAVALLGGSVAGIVYAVAAGNPAAVVGKAVVATFTGKERAGEEVFGFKALAEAMIKNGSELEAEAELEEIPLNCPGVTQLPGLRIICSPNEGATYNIDSFPVAMGVNPVVRARKTGDTLRLSGGTKTLKKLLIDQKIPVAQREQIPVIADDNGVVMAVGIGGNLDRLSLDKDAIRIEIQYL